MPARRVLSVSTRFESRIQGPFVLPLKIKFRSCQIGMPPPRPAPLAGRCGGAPDTAPRDGPARPAAATSPRRRCSARLDRWSLLIAGLNNTGRATRLH